MSYAVRKPHDEIFTNLKTLTQIETLLHLLSDLILSKFGDDHLWELTITGSRFFSRLNAIWRIMKFISALELI